MKEDLCKEPREIYDKCYQDWLDTEFFKNNVKGPFTPCKVELDTYHACLRLDPKRSAFLDSLQENKEKFK